MHYPHDQSDVSQYQWANNAIEKTCEKCGAKVKVLPHWNYRHKGNPNGLPISDFCKRHKAN